MIRGRVPNRGFGDTYRNCAERVAVPETPFWYTSPLNGKVRTMVSKYVDPVGNKQKMKGVTTFVSANEHRYEAWQTGPDGEMFKSMEIVYSRK